MLIISVRVDICVNSALRRPYTRMEKWCSFCRDLFKLGYVRFAEVDAKIELDRGYTTCVYHDTDRNRTFYNGRPVSWSRIYINNPGVVLFDDVSIWGMDVGQTRL